MNTMTPATKKTHNARDKARRAAETSSQRETRRAKRRARDRGKPRRVAKRASKRATLAPSRLRATSVSWKVPGWCDDAFAPAMRLLCDSCFAGPFFSEATLLAHRELNPCGATCTRSTNVPLAKSTSTTLKPLESTLVSHCDVCKCPRTFNSLAALQIHQKAVCQRVASPGDASPSRLVGAMKTRIREVAHTSEWYCLDCTQPAASRGALREHWLAFHTHTSRPTHKLHHLTTMRVDANSDIDSDLAC